jgi:RND family efflux transporter MFP subunit
MNVRLLLTAWAACGLAGALLAADAPSRSPGITEPILDVTLSAAVPGTVAVRHFKEGDFVRQGQVVAELDKRLEELTVTRRKLLVDNLKIDLEGTEKLFNTTKSVSKDEYLKKELEFRVATVDHETALEQLRKRLTITPLDGYITEFYVEVGEERKEQEPMVRIVDTRQCYFVSNVEARAGAHLKVGQKVELEIESGATVVKVIGELTFVSPVVDPASGLMKVKALFDNPDGRIRPGVAGVLKLEGGPHAQ